MQKFTPLHALLKSEESIPIQIADIIAGAVRWKLMNNEKPPLPLSHLYFDNRKIDKESQRKNKFAKGYYWFRNN